MDKTSLSMIINDLRSRRDALSLAHENLEIESDNWNKCVVVTSLMTGMFESIKLRMGWNSNVVDFYLTFQLGRERISVKIKGAETGEYR